MKVCTKCKVLKELDNFYKKKNGSSLSECKKCHYERCKKWVKANPVKRKKTLQKHVWKTKAKVCPICNVKQIYYSGNISKACSLKCRIKFFSEVDVKTGCWNWKGAMAGEYGKTRWKCKTFSAHKASYLSFKGEIPKGLCVCHECDNKLCVNPEHLYLATHAVNWQHAVDRGLINYKNRNLHFKKLSDVQIEEMKKLKKEGFTYLRLSMIFNCCITHVWKVIKGKLRR